MKTTQRSLPYTIGIDEAGRGPLAGPVVVAGIKISVKRKAQSAKLWKGIRDSKKLSAKRREEWFLVLTANPEVEWAVSKVWPKVIDRINIAQAANLGAARVYERLSLGGKRLSLGRTAFAVLDGSLHLSQNIPHETIIKGDEKIPLIAAASIIAKVIRDRTMRRLHKKYPQYRFDIHKGYATRMHRRLTKKFGYSQIHRRSFKIAKS